MIEAKAQGQGGGDPVGAVEQTHLAWGVAALSKAQHIRDNHWASWAGAVCEAE